jgi:S-adenosylmethionine decarboxylase
LFFEGSEKKAEIQINTQKISLLNDFNDTFWATFVNCSKAKILSAVSNKYCKAFLLSESSLFVWDDRLVILTCGETQLVNAIEFFIQQIGVDNIEQLIYQRKNEYFSHQQPSSFEDDIKLLSQYVKGKAYRFGEMDSHHNYVFHQDNHFSAAETDKTYELLAYQISEQASQKLTTPNLDAKDIRQFLAIDTLLPNFVVDDFVFTPYGYSLNAINDKNYLTIHVTPQADTSYVSFESNINLIELAPKILSILAPASFDLLSFNEFDFRQLITTHIPAFYISKSLVNKKLSNGYDVCFANFIKPQQQFTQPKSLSL